MNVIDWKSETDFLLKGVKFKCVLSDFENYNTTADEIIIVKDRPAIEIYQAVFEKTPPQQVMEFGTYQGGSPALLTLLFNLQKYVGIDLGPQVPGFEDFLRKHPDGRKISIYNSTSQDDGEAIRSIVHKEFGDKPIDLIIDDASHQYDFSRRTFEIAFPLLRPGGTYILEDWGWAHWPGYLGWQDAPALSNLVFQLTILNASHSEIIQEMRTFPVILIIKKSDSHGSNEELCLDNLVGERGRHLNLI
jgi:cephalosporin hydroxylase